MQNTITPFSSYVYEIISNNESKLFVSLGNYPKKGNKLQSQ